MAITLTGCDPAKKTPAGPQGMNNGGGDPFKKTPAGPQGMNNGGGDPLQSNDDNKGSEYPNSNHLFFEFHKNMKPLEKSLLFSTLDNELLEEYIDKKNRKYMEIFKKLQDDFIPFTNMVIKRELMEEYLSGLNLNKAAKSKLKSSLVVDLFNEYEQEFFNNTGSYYNDALERYRYLIQLVSFEMNDNVKHNELLSPGGDINTYMKSVWKYIQKINADPLVVPYLNELDSYLEKFKLNTLVLGDKIQTNTLHKKLIQLYGAKWFDNIILSKEIENAKRNKDEQGEVGFNQAKKEYKKEQPADENYSEDIEREYEKVQKKHEKDKDRNNSSFLFKSK